MANTVQIKRSATTATPSSLAVGELAYSSQSGNMFIGEAGNTITKVGGNTDVLKLAGIEAGAQVNTVTSVAGRTGNVTLSSSDVSGVLATGDIGVTVQGYNANLVVDGSYVHTDNNFTTALKSKLDGVEAGAQVNTVTSVNTKTGAVSLTYTDVGAEPANANIQSHIGSTSNPHSVTASQVGLGNVTNESKATMFTDPTFTGNATCATAPTSGNHLTNKTYVDGMSLGISVKDPVKAATTAAITLANTQTIDGISLVATDRVLVKDQADATTNGVYVVVDGGSWTRATDFDNSPTGEVRNGTFVYVQSGTTNAYTQFVLAVEGAVDIGTTELVFVQFGSVASYSAGTGLTLTGTTFAIDSSVVTESGGVLEALSGANLTSLNATNLSSGTVADARLSGNVLLNTSTIDCGTF